METCLIDSDVPLTFKDHPSVFSAVFYTNLQLCNLNCYKCHNKHLSKNEKIVYLSVNKLKTKLQQLKLFNVKLVIICGGEPTLVPFEELKKVISIIKSFGFFVRLDTNGQKPDVIKKLIDENLVDGFAIDIKIPLSTIKKHYGKILFSAESFTTEIQNKIRLYQENLKASLKLLSNSNLKFNILRTVNYPIFDENDLNLIKKDVKQFNINHYINEFIDV